MNIKLRSTVPSRRAGQSASIPHGSKNVHYAAECEQGIQHILRRIQDTGRCGAARCAICVTITVSWIRVLLPAQWGGGGRDATSQGNGGDERDEGIGEQHCQGCLKIVVLDVLVDGGALRSLEGYGLPFYNILSMPDGKMISKTSAPAIDR